MPSGFALIISIDYQNPTGTSDLAGAIRRDGVDVASLLAQTELSGFLPQQITHLHGHDATKANVIRALQSIASAAKQADPVLTFFSGHGAQKDSDDPDRSCLALYGFNPSTREGVLGVDVLKQYWSAIPSERKLFLVDACYAGGLDVPKNIDDDASEAMNKAFVESLSSGSGTVTIASSSADQSSVWRRSDRNSLFTTHLLDGLRGGPGHDHDGYVRVFELFTYIAEKVRADAPGQMPIYAARAQTSNFPVAFCKDKTFRKSYPDRSSILTGTDDVSGGAGLFARLYPEGPGDLHIWERAGGDMSRIRLSQSGRAQWFDAFKLIHLGGGGACITSHSLIEEALNDYPYHNELSNLMQST